LPREIAGRGEIVVENGGNRGAANGESAAASPVAGPSPPARRMFPLASPADGGGGRFQQSARSPHQGA